MSFKFNFDLLSYGLYISAAVLLCLALLKFKFKFKYVASAYCMSINVD